MIKYIIPGFFIIFILFFSCKNEGNLSSNYLRNVGDIEFDNLQDKKDFYLCNKDKVAQYFNFSQGLQYEGEKKAIEDEFLQKYNKEKVKKENGWIRIRFIVNCKGETDRFRLMEVDENYKEKKFDPLITHQLMNITKNLKGWKSINYEGKAFDYYQYLIFKIENGSIQEILP